METKFVSLGMVVLDELRFPDAPTMYDVAGGSGAYSTVCASLLSVAVDSSLAALVLLIHQEDTDGIEAF